MKSFVTHQVYYVMLFTDDTVYTEVEKNKQQSQKCDEHVEMVFYLATSIEESVISRYKAARK